MKTARFHSGYMRLSMNLVQLLTRPDRSQSTIAPSLPQQQ